MQTCKKFENFIKNRKDPRQKFSFSDTRSASGPAHEPDRTRFFLYLSLPALQAWQTSLTPRIAMCIRHAAGSILHLLYRNTHKVMRQEVGHAHHMVIKFLI